MLGTKITLTKEEFGPLYYYIQQDNVTDINYNGYALWIEDLQLGVYKSDVTITEEFLISFTNKIKNLVSESFNRFDNVLEAETENMRISIFHESIANTGRAFSIRKTPPKIRLSLQEMIKIGYCTNEISDLLSVFIRQHKNIVVCGLPGHGKTELLKYCTTYIPEYERVITIEDNLEIHYHTLYPQRDCIELKVDPDIFTYKQAIKACLRQNPQWILLSEARGEEVKYLIESLSAGTHGITTIHCDNVTKIPDRILNMMNDFSSEDKLLNDIYTFLDVGILVKKQKINNKIYRYIDQICLFNRLNGINSIELLVDNRYVVNREAVQSLLKMS